MQFTYQQVEDAFGAGDINIHQFIEILVENFGKKATRRLIKKNLKRAIRHEAKVARDSSPHSTTQPSQQQSSRTLMSLFDIYLDQLS